MCFMVLMIHISIPIQYLSLIVEVLPLIYPFRHSSIGYNRSQLLVEHSLIIPCLWNYRGCRNHTHLCSTKQVIGLPGVGQIGSELQSWCNSSLYYLQVSVVAYLSGEKKSFCMTSKCCLSWRCSSQLSVDKDTSSLLSDIATSLFVVGPEQNKGAQTPRSNPRLIDFV